MENEKEIDIEVKAEEDITESPQIVEKCIEKEFVEVASSEEKVKAIEQNEPQVQNQDNDSEYYKGLPLDIFFMETEVEEEEEEEIV